MFLIRLKLSERRVLCRLHTSNVALHLSFLCSASLNISFRENDSYERLLTNQTV
jgi:hypothetical protein